MLLPGAPLAFLYAAIAPALLHGTSLAADAVQGCVLFRLIQQSPAVLGSSHDDDPGMQSIATQGLSR